MVKGPREPCVFEALPLIFFLATFWCIYTITTHKADSPGTGVEAPPKARTQEQ